MMKFFIRLAFVLVSTVILFECTGNQHMYKALRSTYFSGKTGPTIDDVNLFETRKVENGRQYHLEKSIGYDLYDFDSTLWEELESYDPAAYVVVHKGQIILEHYWDDYSDASYINSFSVAKSIIGLGVMKALQYDIIHSLDQKVIEFIPELKGEYREEVTIRHLLSMTSGINFDESYGNPFGFMAKAYYGTDLLNKTLSYEAEDKPGEEWKYLGGNTILLSIILSRVSDMTLSEFISRFVWAQCGASTDAYWSLDAKGGIEKAYCCFYTNLLDFAHLGLMIIDKGYGMNRYQWNEDILAELKKPVVLNNGQVVPHYSLHWWKINYKGADVTYARGIKGQYIIAIPEYNMVIVRLGHDRGDKNEFQHPEDLYIYLEMAYTFHNQSVIGKKKKSI